MEAGEIVIMITTESMEEARQIAEVLLERRKVACVNIVPGINSFFWWRGKREAAAEVLLVAKSRGSLFPEVVELVKRNHSYEVPEVIALPIIGANPDYTDWIYAETRAEGEGK